MAIMINHEGDIWEIIGEGVTRDGETYCHLRSTTRFHHHKNGAHPVQMVDWIDNNIILSSAIQTEETQRKNF